jgi:3-hydroxymyristoyl/3-hydroxydecanoyl-(acyl carrier protein) dehydratase
MDAISSETTTNGRSLSMLEEPKTIHKVITLEKENALFNGHFPGFPVYPGVAQIQDVCTMLSEHFGRPTHIVRMTRTKFLELILPPATLNISCQIKDRTVSWDISKDGAIVCKGRGDFDFPEGSL